MWGGRAAAVSSFRLWMLQDCLYWHASATWHGHQGQCFWISRQVWWPPSVRTRTRGCVPEAHSSSSPEKSIRGSWRRGGNVVFDLDVAQQTRTTPSAGSWILVLSWIHSQRGDGLYQDSSILIPTFMDNEHVWASNKNANWCLNSNLFWY